MLSTQEYLIVIAVIVVYAGIRYMPRLIAGPGAYVSATQTKQDMDRNGELLMLDVRSPTEFVDQPGL